MALKTPEDRRDSYSNRHEKAGVVDYENLSDITGEIQAMSDHLVYGEKGTFLTDKNLEKLPDEITLFRTGGENDGNN